MLYMYSDLTKRHLELENTELCLKAKKVMDTSAFVSSVLNFSCFWRNNLSENIFSKSFSKLFREHLKFSREVSRQIKLRSLSRKSDYSVRRSFNCRLFESIRSYIGEPSQSKDSESAMQDIAEGNFTLAFKLSLFWSS